MQDISQELQAFEFWVAMAGTVAFAVTAVLAVVPRGIDLFGACVMGVITAIGGGTIRDLVLGVPLAPILLGVVTAIGGRFLATTCPQIGPTSMKDGKVYKNTVN